MKIKTDNLKKFAKVFSASVTPELDDYKSVYLDFKEDKLKFLNRDFAFSCPLEILDKEEHENMFVDGKKFFYLVSTYGEFELSGNVFLNNGNKFNVPKLDHDIEFPTSEYEAFSEFSIPLDAEFKKVLDKCSKYIDKDDNQFSSLFFRNSHALIINPKRMLFCKMSNELPEDFDIPFKFLRIINLLNIDTLNIKLKKKNDENDGTSFELSSADFWIRFSTNSKYAMPSGLDVFGEKFRSSYYHQNYFEIERTEVEKILGLASYFSDIQNPIYSFTFNLQNPDDKHLVLRVGNTDEMEYKVRIKDTSDSAYLEGKKFCIYSNVLTTIMDVIKESDTIKVRYSEDTPSICFTNSTDDDVIAIHTVIEDF